MIHSFPSPQERQGALALSLAKVNGLVRAKDFVANHISAATVSRLVAAGKLEKQSRGLYRLPDQPLNEHATLAQVALRAPRGVICLLSALTVHDIGTQSPFEVWLAIDHKAWAPKFVSPRVRVIRMSGSAFEEGIETLLVDGVPVKVFNTAKTVADCFKFRNKIGLDVALEALQDGLRKRRFTRDELWKCACIDRVAETMRSYMESLSL
jgi:predicted transcriptional regulator of viral defense system